VATADIEHDFDRRALLVIFVLVKEIFERAEPISARAVVGGEGVPRPEHRVVQ
jgi:hypothetical protein